MQAADMAAALPPPPPPPRSFAFKHIAKTGGQTVRTALAHGITGDVHIFAERDVLDTEVRTKRFVVSTVRNSCALYVSLWAYGCTGRGRFNDLFVKEYPLLSYVFEDVANRSNFNVFARAAAGEFSRRYRDYLPGFGADCWIHTETLGADLRGCLHRYERQDGRLQRAPPTDGELAAFNVHKRSTVRANITTGVRPERWTSSSSSSSSRRTPRCLTTLASTAASAAPRPRPPLLPARRSCPLRYVPNERTSAPREL